MSIDDLRERALDMIEPPSRRYVSQRTLSRISLGVASAALALSAVALVLSL